jgi:hypothetical protein
VRQVKPKAEMSEFNDHFYPVRIAYIATPRGWRKFLSNINAAPEPYPQAAACVTTFAPANELEIIVITVNKRARNRSAGEVMGILAHELIHVKQQVEGVIYRRSSGAGYGRLDIETEAYLMHKMLMWINDAYAKIGPGVKE